jgi:lysophospholipase L1-like esterase
MKGEQHAPWITAILIALVLGVFALFAYFNPRSEYDLGGGIALRMPQWHPWEDWAAALREEAETQRRQDSLETWALADTVEVSAPLRRPKPGQGAIQFSDSDTLGMAKLAQGLQQLHSGGVLRILHFGDSQIEGDRITGDLRDALQALYGGEGAGMQPLVPFVPMAAVAHTAEGAWTRMVSFGRANDKSPTNMYGPRGISHRYATKSASGPDAKVRFSPRSYGYPRARQSRSFSLLHGPAKGPVEIKWYANDTLWKIDYLDSNARSGALRAVATQPVKSLSLEFRGASPDWYGLSMDGPTGVRVDNVAMRGADGLSFTRMDRGHFMASLQREPVGLVILQFGGNAVPYFKSKEAVMRYGEAFRRQIRLFQEALPGANILVVGPSDMAVKEGLDWVSYPFVDDVRDALKMAAFEEGAAFFDVMDFMGGPGGMVDWVNQNPPLAGPDHIHFTPRGAKKVAKALVESMQAELQRHE